MEQQEPKIKVGIMHQSEITFRLKGNYILEQNGKTYSGEHQVMINNNQIVFDDIRATTLNFIPQNNSIDTFFLDDVTIGIQFHWERKEQQQFKGELHFIIENKLITAINNVLLEDYLVSVISSEMNANSGLELLKAHAIISRSWLIAQVLKNEKLAVNYQNIYQQEGEYIRWYDREDHVNFDVCADDHCQRYQGITRQSSPKVKQAIEATYGVVLMYDNQVCDARFSKCCGGVTEIFENVWEPVPHHYLQAFSDNETALLPDLTSEKNAKSFIEASPNAFCNTNDSAILSQVLNNYDQETPDFYRWKISYTQQELSQLIAEKRGIDFGDIMDLIPLERGLSGRITRMKIVGSKQVMVVGKELEIRKTLSKSHLYSSAFVVEKEYKNGDIPSLFRLRGSGWGHGVGLCQIGAAVMGAKGYDFKAILNHYFRGATLNQYYGNQSCSK